jgi:CheY-like chemotaxis protein
MHLRAPGLPPRRRAILIIDDDDAAREIARESLRSGGYAVYSARDWRHGQERLREIPRPAAILLDLALPRVGGAEFLRRLRNAPAWSAWSELPVVVMLAPRVAAPPGVSDVLCKPLDPDALLRIIRAATEPRDEGAEPQR